jgi:hypothetical protein
MIGNQRERDKKRNDQKKLQQEIESQRKGKEQDHLKKESLGPLRKGKQLDTTETKRSSYMEQGPPKAHKATSHKLTQELPLHICKLPLSQSTLSLNQCRQEDHLEMNDKEQTKLTLPRAVRPPAQAS